MGVEEVDWLRRDSECFDFDKCTLDPLCGGEHVIEFDGLDVVFRLHDE